ncbi:hypothetical protein [Burkholderia sp. LMU1-1-1.1]|uniref:hypothetical protein n=1 Tax=Burkholderia sp. LMU1-1-1.1 TaxID=3135266 RepID=UPI003436FEBF
MEQSAPDKVYELDEQQNAEVVALARLRSESPQSLVREAVAKYLLDADYEMRRKAAFAALKHPERDNTMFGGWKGAGVDGVEYQNELRSE